MKLLFIIMILLGFAEMAVSQSTVKLQLTSNQTIKGEWLGMEDGQYLIGQEKDAILYIPQEMVYKMKVKRSYKDFLDYDKNRNTLIYGVSGDYNTTIGQENQNFQGIGLSASIGYDWDHKYALRASVGYRNMNIGNPETFLPVSLSATKYLTHGRFLLFGGVEAGYNWGIKNMWQSGTGWTPWSSTWIPWQQPRHKKGQGPSVAPLLGVRMIGKHGIDHELSLGLHFQKFQSERRFDDDDYSKIDILYKRWQVSYGLVF